MPRKWMKIYFQMVGIWYSPGSRYPVRPSPHALLTIGFFVITLVTIIQYIVLGRFIRGKGGSIHSFRDRRARNLGWSARNILSMSMEIFTNFGKVRCHVSPSFQRLGFFQCAFQSSECHCCKMEFSFIEEMISHFSSLWHQFTIPPSIACIEKVRWYARPIGDLFKHRIFGFPMHYYVFAWDFYLCNTSRSSGLMRSVEDKTKPLRLDVE